MCLTELQVVVTTENFPLQLFWLIPENSMARPRLRWPPVHLGTQIVQQWRTSSQFLWMSYAVF